MALVPGGACRGAGAGRSGKASRDSAWPRHTGSQSITVMAPSLIDQSQDDS